MRWIARNLWPVIFIYALIGVAWACDAGSKPQKLVSEYSQETTPMPITQMIHVRNVFTEEETVWYAKGDDIVFPHEGTYVFTRWDITNGTVIYKARLVVGKGVIVFPTDRDVEAGGE